MSMFKLDSFIRCLVLVWVMDSDHSIKRSALEAVVMKALRNKVSEFRSIDQIDPRLAKFVVEKIDFTRSEGMKLLG